MQDYIYSVIAFVAMAIHLIINFGLRADRELNTAHGAREYRGFLKSVFAYYVTDACWGVLAGLGWTSVLYVDTMVYYIAIAVSVIMWCRFVVSYLDLRRWTARIVSWFGYALLALYIVLLAANVFNGCLFHFDANGNYGSGSLRHLIFYPLVALNVLMAGFVFVKALGSRDSMRRRNMVAFLFSLTMAVAIVLQIVWPLWPYYALGCLIGCCFFHVFVVEDERAELRRAVIEREQTAKHAAELEKALDRACAAEKARSMFFSIVSHDIRTPLNAIIGYSELLQLGVGSEAEKEEALKSIHASGTTLLDLVNDVLDLSKMDSGKMTLKPEPVRMEQLTDEVFASFKISAAEKGVELVNRTAGLPTVLIDAHHLRQILFNLVGNAVKFTARGSVTVAAFYADSRLEVSVADTGCGIAPDLIARIFDPFVQAQDPRHSAYRAGGTGLGLSICRKLAEVMGGEVSVESELGRGSTFRITIPGVKVAGGTTGTSGTDATGDLGSAPPVPSVPPVPSPSRVLVVDDSEINRAVLAALLAHAGVESVDQAEDGEKALAKMDSALKAGNPHDFVFSDLWMPNMNGIEFAEKLRADSRLSHVPVYAVTADAEFVRDDRSSLFTGILLKPLTYSKLVEAFGRR